MTAPRTARVYRALRRARGTQQSVARALGVDIRTVQRREAGEVPVTREALAALRALAELKKQTIPTQ